MDLHKKTINNAYNTMMVVIPLLLLSFGHLHTIQGLQYSNISRNQQFTFPDNKGPTPQQPQPQPRQLPQPQTRQLPQPQTRQLPQSAAPNSGVLTRQFNPVPVSTSYCICVPPGSCPNPIPVPTSSPDGSGQIDIRIVNNPFAPTVAPTLTPTGCSYGLTVCCMAGTYQCGRNYPPPPNSLPAGAGQASFGEYPWQVALLTLGEVYLGSGGLITAQHVLTVAHKVANVAVSSFKVRVGEWDASGTSEPIPAQDVMVSNVFIHPNYNSANLQNDVAILKLVAPVPLNTKSTVGTICLPTTAFVGQRCYVAGWGKNDFGPTGAYQAIQREVDVPLVANDACQAAMRATRLGASFLLNTSSFICAGGEGGKDACTGDGGSPLVCQSNGLWYMVGMVAWGIGCATAGIPGVYVNVATYLPWIQSMLTV